MTDTTQAARAREKADRALEGTITPDGLYHPETGARAWMVRDIAGWHRLLSVNPNSVTVTAPHGARRIPLQKLREVRFQ